MNEEPKHMKVTSTTVEPDGTKNIQSKSYYEKLQLQVDEMEKPLVSSFYTLKKDVELALEHVLKDGSPRLVLTIEPKKGEIKLTKKWVTLRQDYPRR